MCSHVYACCLIIILTPSCTHAHFFSGDHVCCVIEVAPQQVTSLVCFISAMLNMKGESTRVINQASRSKDLQLKEALHIQTIKHW